LGFLLRRKKADLMPGQSQTMNKIFNVLKYVVGGLGIVTAFIPGLQPVAALLGVTSGAMALASGISNMVQEKQAGTLTTANKIANITDIVSGSIGMAAPVVGAIADEATTAATAAQSAERSLIFDPDQLEPVGYKVNFNPNQAEQSLVFEPDQLEPAGYRINFNPSELGKTALVVSTVAKGVQNAMKGVKYASSVVNAAATVPNTFSQLIRKKDFYDDDMQYIP
jgi:AMMECR1 domain-containing protein